MVGDRRLGGSEAPHPRQQASDARGHRPLLLTPLLYQYYNPDEPSRGATHA